MARHVRISGAMNEQKEQRNALSYRGRSGMRYGGIAMAVVGAAASLAVPAAGVPLILLGVVFIVIGFSAPAAD